MSALTLLRDTVSRLIAEIDRLDPGNIEAARASGVMSAVAAMDFAPIVEPSARKKAGRSTRIADERDHAMAASYRSGRTILEVATEFKACTGTVRKALDRCDVRARPKGPVYDKKRAPRVVKILELRAQGLDASDIGKAVGVTRERVRQILVREGVPTGQINKPLTDAERRAVDMYVAGASLDAAAEINNIPISRCRALILREGRTLRPSNRRGHTQEVLERAKRVAELYKSGWKVREIAAELGLPKPELIYRYLAIAGVRANRFHRTTLKAVA
jgi:transposase-like protein